MPRRSLCLALTLLSGCFEDSPVAESTGTGAGTVSGDTGTSQATLGADSTGAGSADACGSCQSAECTEYAQACAADPGCTQCLAGPYNLTCLADPVFHAIASCSCEECAGECADICPGGQGACNSCGITQCKDEGDACLGDPSCAPCLDDAYAEGCAENPVWMTALACSCAECGQECIWQCPAAGNTCATCISGGCSMFFTACIEDEACADCFEAPFSEGCAENELYAQVAECTCETCPDDCGVLFNCGE